MQVDVCVRCGVEGKAAVSVLQRRTGPGVDSYRIGAPLIFPAQILPVQANKARVAQTSAGVCVRVWV